VLSAAAALAFILAGGAAVVDLFSRELGTMGPDEAQRVIDEIVATRGAAFGLSFLAMAGIWLLSVADAWLVARRP
jgi:hypothetical protein